MVVVATVWSPTRAATVAFSGIAPRFWTFMMNVILPPTVSVVGFAAIEPIARSGLALTDMIMVTLCDTGPLVATTRRV